MSTIAPTTPTKPKKERTLVRSNPILNRMSKVQERSETNSATYAGIARKTCFFLALTLVGMIVQLLVSAAMAGQPIWQTVQIYKRFTLEISKPEAIIAIAVVLVGFVAELIGIFVRKTTPVTGTIYSLSQGYLISFLVFKILKGFEYLGLEALLLTVAIVAVMSWLYSSGIVKGGKKFRTVLLTLILGSILFGVLSFIGSLIPATRPFVQAMMNNRGLVIAFDIIGILIAALFLISDFVMIDSCVKEHYPKDYEWSAAFGLVFTVIWLYLKILDLLMQVAGDSKGSSK